MKILISPIAVYDPYFSDGSEGAALAAYRYVHPDCMYLIPTAEGQGVSNSTSLNASKTKEEIDKIFPNVSVYIKDLDVGNPTDFNQVFREIRRIFERIRAANSADSENEFYINVTSDIPQIHIACLFAVLSRILPAKALQIADPRYCSNDDRVSVIKTLYLEETSTIEKVCRLYEPLMFDACVQELKSLSELTTIRSRRDSAEIWLLLCQAYSALDRLDYEESRSAMLNVMDRIKSTSEFDKVEDLLKEQFSTLERLAKSERVESEFILKDIYHNAMRCFQREAYADTLARIWRFLEGAMFYYLRARYKIEPNDLNKSKCDIRLDEIFPVGCRYLSFETSLSGLKGNLHDAEFCDFLQRKIAITDNKRIKVESEMHKIQNLRNKSVIAHGVQTIKKPTADESLHLASEWWTFFFPQSDLGQYPFAKDNLLSVGRIMRGLM